MTWTRACRLPFALILAAAACGDSQPTEPVTAPSFPGPLLATASAHAAGSGSLLSFDLRSDWADGQNPNGPWSLHGGDQLLAHVADLSSTGIDGWPSPQPGFSGQPVFGDITPVWFRAVAPLANGTPDYELGDVVTHTSRPSVPFSNVRWTSDLDAVVDVAGSVWATREFGRTNDWFLYRNGDLLTSGTVAGGDPYDRDAPFDLAAGSGGADALHGLVVSAGDVIKLEFEQQFGFGEDYVGVELTVSVTAPSSRAACAGDGWAAFGFSNRGRCLLAVRSSGTGASRVAVCHRIRGSDFRLLRVAGSALPAHLGHGDGLPGGSVPGSSAVFDEQCRAV